VASRPAGCIFCKIVRKQAPAHVVCEDERTLVFMDIFPVAEGHALIVPKAHCDDIFGASPADLRAVADRSHELAHAIRDVLAPDGLSVFQLNGVAAGQTVFHYHMHLIPRKRGASLAIHSRKPGDPARMAEIAKQLGDAIRSGGLRPSA
jgi:histidine triad (HIT) family protein